MVLTGLITAERKKSTRNNFILICPVLKSSPATNTYFCLESSTTPGTNVFCRLRLIYVQPSTIHATAKIVDGLISGFHEKYSLVNFRKYHSLTLQHLKSAQYLQSIEE